MKKYTVMTWLFIISSVLYLALLGLLVWLVIVLVNADPEDRDNWGQGMEGTTYELHSVLNL